MADHSAIEWTGATWNCVLGCDKVSDGCRYCYAIQEAWKKQHHPNAKIAAAYAGLVKRLPDGSLNWTGKVTCLPDRLELPLHWRQPRRIFVNSLSDLFHEDVPYEFVESVFRIMALCPQHTFQILTKRPHRMREFTLNRHAGTYENHPLPNVWLGISVEDQRSANERIPFLVDTPAAVRFLSCEPLLGLVELDDWLKVRKHWKAEDDIGQAPWHPPYPKHWYEPQALVLRDWSCPISWVIAGGESGPGYRPMDLAWIRSLRDQCAAAGVAFFAKQNSGPRTHMWLPEDLQSHEFPEPRREVAHV